MHASAFLNAVFQYMSLISYIPPLANDWKKLKDNSNENKAMPNYNEKISDTV